MNLNRYVGKTFTINNQTAKIKSVRHYEEFLLVRVTIDRTSKNLLYKREQLIELFNIERQH